MKKKRLPKPNPLKHFYIPALLILAVGILIYSNTFQSSFQFDDYVYVVDNQDIRNFDNLKNVWSVPVHASRFVSFLSFAINYQFHQLDVFGYHVTNLIIHLINGFLVWWLMYLIFITPPIKKSDYYQHRHPISLFVALVFIAHPIQTEAVTYITQRFTSLAVLFYLTSLCLYIKARLSNKKEVGLFVGAALAALLGMFTKEIVITLPLMIVLVEAYFFDLFNKKNKASILKNKKIFVPLALFFLIIPTIYSFKIKAIFFDPRQSASHPGDFLTLGNYFLTQMRVIVTYIKLLFIPVGQNLLYDFPASKSLFEVSTFLCFTILSCILTIGIYLYKRQRLISFAIIWFFISLLVESSIIPIHHVIFEHRLYLGMVGFALLIGLLAFIFISRLQIRYGALILIVVMLSVLTYQRNNIWKDEIVMWTDVSTKSPRKPKVYLNLGRAYAATGQYEMALATLTKAIELLPNYGMAYSNRGVVLKKLGYPDLALKDFEMSIKFNPGFLKSYNNRGNLYSETGKQDLALLDYNKVLERDPNNDKAYLNRGALYNAQNKHDLALKDFNKAIEINPYSIESYNNRGIIYSIRQNDDLAKANFDKAIELRPNYEEAYINRGVLYEMRGKYDLALSDFNNALNINSNRALSYVKRAGVLRQLRRFKEALADYNMALKLNPNIAQAFNERGTLFGMFKQNEVALSDLNNAVRLAPNYAEAYNNRGVVYKVLKKLNLAIEDFNKAIELNPKYTMAHNNKGTIYNEQGKYALAVKYYTNALDVDAQFFEARYNRGVAYFNLTEFEKALDDYNKVIKSNPNFLRAYMKRGNAYFAVEKYDLALKDYNVVLQANPNNNLAYFNRSLIYKQMNNINQAIKDALKAKSLGQTQIDPYIEELRILARGINGDGA